MTITTEKGTRTTKWSDEDIIIKYNEIPISFKEVGQILLLLWENEDKRYPPNQGLRGAKMSLDFINELFETRKVTDEMLEKYHLKK
jgi:hypothetical protein